MGSVETIAAWAAIAISQALAGSQSVPGTADDLGGLPTAQTLASRATQGWDVGDTLILASAGGLFFAGLALGRASKGSGGER